MVTAKRHIVVRADDLLIVNGMILDGEVLKAIVNPEKRLLWGFVKHGPDIRLVCYSEEKVIWLGREEEDVR